MTNLIIANLNKYIEENHIKQTWIAESLNTHKMNISNILSGKKKNVSFDELRSVIDVLGLDFSDVNNANFKSTQVFEEKYNSNFMAFCGSVQSEKTRQTLVLVDELIEMLENFKSSADLVF